METNTPPFAASVQTPSTSSSIAATASTRTSDSHSCSLQSRRRINIQSATDGLGSVCSSDDEDSTSSNDQTNDLNAETAPDKEFEKLVANLSKLELNDADGADSDIEGEEFEIFDSSYAKAVMERRSHGDGGLHVKEINNGDIAFVIAEDGVLAEDNEIDLDALVKKPPDDWVRPAKKVNDEPDFESLDNPGNWCDFIYRPTYKKIGTGNSSKYKYIRHELPTGCSVVPANNEGRRIVNGWEFFYNGWKSKKKNSARDGAAPDDLFPKQRQSSLDGAGETVLHLLFLFGFFLQFAVSAQRRPSSGEFS